ncbi:MAG TPA: SurA N-terminal domain-containing protein, partial [Vicinamibacteria bacterium]
MHERFCRLGVAFIAAAVVGAACDETAAPQTSAAGGKTRGGVVAHVGDQQITLDEVDARAQKANMKAFQELYEARKEALEELVADALLEQEARARGMSQEDLEAKEIHGKVAAVDEQEVRAFYDQNRARLGDRTLEELAPQIRAFLVSRNEAIA